MAASTTASTGSQMVEQLVRKHGSLPMPQDVSQKDQEDWNTRLAEERTLLEHERTLAAWIRTALATLVLGFAVAELLHTTEPRWLTRVLGAALILVGGGMLAVAYRSYRGAIRQRKERRVPGIPPWVLALFVLILMLGAVAGLVLVAI